MNKKKLASLVALFVCVFLPLFLGSCGSDDNADFNIYFVGVGTNTNENFSENQPLQKIVSDDCTALNQKWQTTIMNEKEALSEFEKFSVSMETKLRKQVKEGALTINGETYFTLVLSHSVKHGQDYPVIATYKITLTE